jgi:hypothetical protein
MVAPISSEPDERGPRGERRSWDHLDHYIILSNFILAVMSTWKVAKIHTSSKTIATVVFLELIRTFPFRLSLHMYNVCLVIHTGRVLELSLHQLVKNS